MSNLRYTREHEWLRDEDDGSLTIGITDYAQEQLGDVVYVELPDSGAHVDAGDNLAVVESVKAVGEIAAPVAGTVGAVNERLGDEPELVNQSPLADGWLLRITPDADSEPDELMDEAGYQAFVAAL